MVYHQQKCLSYNTVAPNENFNINKKNLWIYNFIGSLYKQKKIFDLIEAYRILINNKSIALNLEIIGDGEEFDNLKKYIDDNNLTNYITLHGNVTEDDKLLPIMQRAAVCVSLVKPVYQFKNVFLMVQVS